MLRMKNIFCLKKTMGKKYVFVLCLLIWIAVAEAQVQVKLFNVNTYGAISDEKTDNSVVRNHAYMLTSLLNIFL